MQWVKDNFLPQIEQMAKSHFSRSIHFQLKLDEQAAASTETIALKEVVSTETTATKEEMIASPALTTSKPSSRYPRIAAVS